MGDGCNPSLRENDGWVAAWLVQAYPQTENPWKVHSFWKMLEQILQAVPFCTKEIELHLPSYVTFKVERYPSHPSGNIDHTVDGSEILHHLGCIKNPCLNNGILPTSTAKSRDFWLPSKQHGVPVPFLGYWVNWDLETHNIKTPLGNPMAGARHQRNRGAAKG